MKIITGKYPEEKNIDLWLSAPSLDCRIVFLWRLATYVRDVVKKQRSGFGGRTTAEQQALYDLYLAGKGNKAAKPGTSPHEFGLAFDFNRVKTIKGAGVYPGTLDADYLLWIAGKPETLNKYGLRHAVKGEPWHIQPIETAGYKLAISKFADLDDLSRKDYEKMFEDLNAQIKVLAGQIATLKNQAVVKDVTIKNQTVSITALNAELLSVKTALTAAQLTKKETAVLYKGCPDGEPVKEWQESLLKCGYKMINDAGILCTADGDFGGGTFNGTNLFKKDVSLPQDGKVDAITYAKMLNKHQWDNAQLTKNLITEEQTVNALTTQNISLRAGAAGQAAEIKRLQDLMIADMKADVVTAAANVAKNTDTRSMLQKLLDRFK